jgi:cytoskeletal protein RodZ
MFSQSFAKFAPMVDNRLGSSFQNPQSSSATANSASKKEDDSLFAGIIAVIVVVVLILIVLVVFVCWKFFCRRPREEILPCETLNQEIEMVSINRSNNTELPPSVDLIEGGDSAGSSSSDFVFEPDLEEQM